MGWRAAGRTWWPGWPEGQPAQAAPAGYEVDNPTFVSDLKALADADLVMDTANPSVPLLEGVVRVSDKVPNLRIVIDHLPQIGPPQPSGPPMTPV